jgi:hypothetical protein
MDLFEMLDKLRADYPTMSASALVLSGIAIGGIGSWVILNQRLKHNREVIEHWKDKAGERTPVEKEKRLRIRESLGEFLIEGHQILNLCHQENSPAPSAQVNSWDERVKSFLSENLDKSYIARFHDWSDLPIAATTIVSSEHRDLWSGMRVRLARLQQFIARLSDE